MTNLQSGRLLGLLILLQFVAGVAINFGLTAPLFADGGFIANGASNATRLGLSSLLAVLLVPLALGIAVLLYHLLQSRPRLALLLLSLSIVAAVMALVEQITVLSLVSYSEAYQQADTAMQATLMAMKGVVASLRNWAHYIALICGGLAIFTTYTALLLTQRVPQWLALLGMVAAVSQLVGVSSPLLGGEVNFLLLAPLALSQLILASYLLWKGVNDDASLA